MPASKKQRELDLNDFPGGSVTEYTTLACLACIFDIFTKQLGLAARTAFSEIKRHTPTIEELTSRNAMRPYFDSDEKNPHCPYCGSAKRWLARFDTYCIEGSKTTDAARRALIKKLPKADEQFLVIEKKSDSRAVFFDWLDTLGRNLELNDESWLVDATRLFLAPQLYSEALLIQYLISRSHAHGGLTLEGRLTLMDLIRRLRYSGYLDERGITEREPGEVFEKLIDHLASTHEWSGVRAPANRGSDRVTGRKKEHVSTGSGSDRVGSKKKSSRSRKEKSAPPEPEAALTESVKLHYVVDRRDFLEKVKSVYASYAG